MRYAVLLCLLLCSSISRAETLQVAVAANFAAPLRELVAQYQSSHPAISIHLTVASTGKLAAQIRQGAPFDIFLAADQRRPRELAREQRLIADSVRTYARGVLVLWTPQSGINLQPEQLERGRLSPLALANARTAPYGVAAEAVLARLSLPPSVTLVRAENVAQSFHFADSGAAAAAFVALSQVQARGGSLWRIPPSQYPAIIQQGGRLNDRPATRDFYRYLFSGPARALIRQAGYQVDDAQ
ncbi:molybdate ABC transporter periplasmic binding protein [Alcanivorax hongdengensis A-11-3]|uniref:Molybdate ABC transporter periplasmic binding protein n=1 Tax=Alcanivorax hongdengensis A-11-3 TaxID=1177179 RepID=L0W8C8_9GAMM|nr:molybdate ABC transporter substrate-binding protein [Alcanivorax hongdengensis]EKF72963.1 molybdate ABC transporter periplasmic binding protein [Alcanivorax hongdengensis A-11-3]